LSEEKKGDLGGLVAIGAILVGVYLLTRKVEAAPTPPAYVTAATSQPPLYQGGQGYRITSEREDVGKTRTQTWKAAEPGRISAAEPKWQDPTQAPLFHFNKYPADVPPQPGQIVAVQAPRPWAGVTGEGLFNKALEAPLYWFGPPETAGKILVPERYRAIIEKYDVDTLYRMRGPADPAYAEIEKQYGREVANLMIRYALELKNAIVKGYKIEYVTIEHMKILGNKVDERFLADWILGASLTHPSGDPGTVTTRAGQMGLTVDEYKYIALRYFYELHGYIPDQYKDLWNRLDPILHDTWKGFPTKIEKTYAAPSASGQSYSLEDYKKIFGTVPWDEPIPTYRKNGKQQYIWRDPQKPGSVLWGTKDDYEKSMRDAEKAKTPRVPVPMPWPERKIETKEQKASFTSRRPQAKPLPAEEPPTSTPVNPRARETTRARVGQRDMTKQVEAKERAINAVQAINRQRLGPRK